MADPQHPARVTRCPTCGLGPCTQPICLAYPTHEDSDSQHPDIAALVEQLDVILKRERHGFIELGSYEIDSVQQAAAALRTLTRPVEDEEVRQTIEAYREFASMAREHGFELEAARHEDAASLLARLAREKAALAARIRNANDFIRKIGESAVRAKQDAARLRDELGKLQSLCTPEQINKWANWRKRALAAAAGIAR